MGGDQRVSVRGNPRSSQDRILGYDDAAGILRVNVKAAPVNNAANNAVFKLLAKELKLPQAKFRIIQGAKSRDKTLAINTNPSVFTRIKNL